MDVRSPGAASEQPVPRESDTASRMAWAAEAFLAALTPDQRARVLFPLKSEERLNWHYIPRERSGIPLREMDGAQAKLAHGLISTGLSARGYGKAMAIMSLESVLAAMEGPGRRFPRDPDLYHVTLFGSPSDEVPWGWRVEGHHVSLNYLIVGGDRIAPTPSFFGANPARVPEGDRAGLRILAAEEDLARRLLASLDETQRPRARMAAEAPDDIVTRAEHRIRPENPVGLVAGSMAQEQRRILMDLLDEYVGRMPVDVAGARRERIEKEGTGHIRFAWAGSEVPGEPHYYRLHGPGFLLEYDNTQNGANHIHTVWRDWRDDWGEDLLARHYSRSH